MARRIQLRGHGKAGQANASDRREAQRSDPEAPRGKHGLRNATQRRLGEPPRWRTRRKHRD